ncbi:MAG: TMEM175 family protein [Thermoanaerobaculia bacterium]
MSVVEQPRHPFSSPSVLRERSRDGAAARISSRLVDRLRSRAKHPAAFEPTDAADAKKETGRVEAFSDGVFAIAITLLVLDLKVPRHDAGPLELSRALLKQWPTFLACMTSAFSWRSTSPSPAP